jgi:hypothetical protein
MHVEPESLLKHPLRLRGVERATLFRTKERKTLDVIGGELRSEERIGLTRDNGTEGGGKDDETRRRGETKEAARP